MPFDYSSTPLPANLQPRSAAALAAIWQNQKTTYDAFETATNNSITSLNTAIGNKSPSPTPLAIPVRDAGGGFTNAYLNLQGAAAGNTPLLIRAAVGQTNALELVQSFDGTFTFRSLDKDGNGVFRGSVTAGSFIGPNGGLTSPFFNAVGTNPANTPLLIRGATAQTNPLELIQSVGGATTLRSLDINGNEVLLGTVTATGFLGNATTATGLAAPVAFAAAIADYKLLPSVSAGQVLIAAGGQYGDSLGNAIGPLPQQAVPLPAQPAGTNVQYSAISMVPTSGAPVVTSGAVSASGLPLPGYPVGNTYRGMVLVRGATTNPSNVVAAADITSAVLGSGGGGAGGGGGTTDATVRAATLAIQGTNAALPNAMNLADPNAVGIVNLALIRDDATNPGLAAILTRYLQADLAGRITKTGTASVTINAAAGDPATIRFNGKSRQNTAPVSATASGATGQRFLVVDVSPATGFVCTLQATNTVTANTLVVATYWWDNTAGLLYDDIVGLDGLGSMQGIQIAPTIKLVTDKSSGLAYVTTGATVGVWATIPGYPVTTLYLGVPCLMEYSFTHTTTYTAGASGGMNLGLSIDGAAPTEYFNTSVGGNWRTTVTPSTPIALGAGGHNFQVFALKSVAGDTIQVYVPYTRAGLKFWHL